MYRIPLLVAVCILYACPSPQDPTPPANNLPVSSWLTKYAEEWSTDLGEEQASTYQENFNQFLIMNALESTGDAFSVQKDWSLRGQKSGAPGMTTLQKLRRAMALLGLNRVNQGAGSLTTAAFVETTPLDTMGGGEAFQILMAKDPQLQQADAFQNLDLGWQFFPPWGVSDVYDIDSANRVSLCSIPRMSAVVGSRNYTLETNSPALMGDFVGILDTDGNPSLIDVPVTPIPGDPVVRVPVKNLSVPLKSCTQTADCRVAGDTSYSCQAPLGISGAKACYRTYQLATVSAFSCNDLLSYPLLLRPISGATNRIRPYDRTFAAYCTSSRATTGQIEHVCNVGNVSAGVIGWARINGRSQRFFVTPQLNINGLSFPLSFGYSSLTTKLLRKPDPLTGYAALGAWNLNPWESHDPLFTTKSGRVSRFRDHLAIFSMKLTTYANGIFVLTHNNPNFSDPANYSPDGNGAVLLNELNECEPNYPFQPGMASNGRIEDGIFINLQVSQWYSDRCLQFVSDWGLRTVDTVDLGPGCIGPVVDPRGTEIGPNGQVLPIAAMNQLTTVGMLPRCPSFLD